MHSPLTFAGIRIPSKVLLHGDNFDNRRLRWFVFVGGAFSALALELEMTGRRLFQRWSR